MENIMKKQYIQPLTKFQSTNFTQSLCVGSVHGNSPLQFGGGSNGEGGKNPI